MLSLLHIENIAVIESADIQFDRGFNALTGCLLYTSRSSRSWKRAKPLWRSR